MFCQDKGKTVEDIIFDSLVEAQKYVEDKEEKIPEDLTLDFNLICQERWYKSVHGEGGKPGYLIGEEYNISWNSLRNFSEDVVGLGAALNIQFHILPLKNGIFELQIWDNKQYTRLGRFETVSLAQDFAHKDYEKRVKKEIYMIEEGN